VDQSEGFVDKNITFDYELIGHYALLLSVDIPSKVHKLGWMGGREVLHLRYFYANTQILCTLACGKCTLLYHIANSWITMLVLPFTISRLIERGFDVITGIIVGEMCLVITCSIAVHEWSIWSLMYGSYDLYNQSL